MTFSSSSDRLLPLVPELAEVLALQALTWLAEQTELFDQFAATSGVSVEDVTSGAHDATFLGGVLDFVLGDEQTLLKLCHDLNIAPDTPMRARAGLPGGDVPHWT